MKIVLTAINARYIHSNPAIYSLYACVEDFCKEHIEIAEYTINNRPEEILADIYRRKPEIVAFSCYIWNWNMVRALLPELPKVLPDVIIWLGGPEVSFDAEDILEKYPMVTGIMIGEGEETFRELAAYYCAGEKNGQTTGRTGQPAAADAEGQAGGFLAQADDSLDKIAGIIYNRRNSHNRNYIHHETDKITDKATDSAAGGICRTKERALTDLSRLPFLYEDTDAFANRIIYYESSRGCPYRCSYCLSSIDKKVRLRDLAVVKKELQFFLDNHVKQVKFIDRTFNCDQEHAKAIWQYLSKNDNGVTNFHFEIAADILSEEELDILADMRPGLVQLEIGVQTVNSRTLREIRRVTDMDKLYRAVERIVSGGNIHVHLDLIAGLPFEDYESFRHSFNIVYGMRPHQLQLGFLKVLKGSYLHEKAKEYGIQYTQEPPYEVLSSKWISYAEILRLKRVEEMVELYYNSGQFTYTLPVLQTVFPDAFTMYLSLADFYQRKGYLIVTPSRSYRYQALLDHARETELAKEEEMLREVLTFDLYLRENSKSRPEFARDLSPYKMRIRDFYQQEAIQRKYLPEYAAYDSRQLARMTHAEVFNYPVWEEDIAKRRNRLEEPVVVLFDYNARNALTYEARYDIMSVSEKNELAHSASGECRS
ncbi:MAG: B12-binding domain-containing radical SAM protein [Ruminococcus sp.]|nr:B12-binding domain-containing radical SAM protein [Ruminococcus sp.]